MTKVFCRIENLSYLFRIRIAHLIFTTFAHYTWMRTIVAGLFDYRWAFSQRHERQRVEETVVHEPSSRKRQELRRVDCCMKAAVNLTWLTEDVCVDVCSFSNVVD
jgi:hypothetical protein